MSLNEMESSAVFEAAARATINERCAAAFLHDVRGSMQALFSAFELLGRSARMGGGDPLRVEKACDLAKRAITQHEKATMEILGLLTLQHPEVAVVDLGSLVREAVHFLRSDAATKSVALKVDAAPDLTVRVARARLRTLLVGILTAAIDHTQPDSDLLIEVGRAGQEAVITLASDAGFAAHAPESHLDAGKFSAGDLTLRFARQLMSSCGGRLHIEAAPGTTGRLRLYFPIAT